MLLVILLSLALIGTMIYGFINHKKLAAIIQKLQTETLNYEQKQTALTHEILVLTVQKDALSQYQGIIDADEAAKKILLNAEKTAESLLSNSQKDMERALSESSRMKQEALMEAHLTKEQAALILKHANVESEQIISEAKRQTEVITQNVSQLEKTAQALKNVIQGYGDAYIMPTFSLLDDLAAEFGHLQAGEELKNAREKSRLMIQAGTAAQCDYVEWYRKTTAINFVLDTFNSKVDTILLSVKKDNFGTLHQKINDVYHLVNNNGKAFRNAAITEEYRQVRLQELKWAVVVNELKWKEKEEQKLLKEQIREEEKARKEFERTIRETEKEEEMLKKAIEKAQKEVEQANSVQKAKYEAKLAELNEKLKIAEEKNQRAISMAQQTRSGNVYIISNIGSFGEDVYKIGMTRRLEPMDRVKELGDASVPFEFDVHSMIYSKDAPTLEKELHKKFLLMQVNKVNPRKEFFKLPLQEIKKEIDKMGLEVKWTMVAEATQYRESLMIDKSIQSGNFNREEWLKYQSKLAEESTGDEENA